MKTRWHLLLGPVAFLWFFSWIVCLDWLRPEYDFRHKAVSELGAIGAPYMIFMNLLGFIATGFMLVGFAIGIHWSQNRQHWRSSYLLMFSGILFSATSVPIVMGADGDPNYSATMTQIHLGLTQLVPVPWLLAMVSYLWRIRTIEFRHLAIVSSFAMLALVMVIVAAILGVFEGIPGVFQRALFAVYLAWFALVGSWRFFWQAEIRACSQ